MICCSCSLQWTHQLHRVKWIGWHTLLGLVVMLRSWEVIVLSLGGNGLQFLELSLLDFKRALVLLRVYHFMKKLLLALGCSYEFTFRVLILFIEFLNRVLHWRGTLCRPLLTAKCYVTREIWAWKVLLLVALSRQKNEFICL